MTNGEAWGVGESVYISRDGWLHVSFFEQGVEVRVKVETVNGVPEITALHLDSAQVSRTGRPTVITSAMFHRAPLSRLKALALDLRPRTFYAGAPSWGTPPRGPQPLSAERLKETAKVYNQAVADGKPTLEALKARFGIKESTARKYIGRVRDSGVELVPPRGRRPRARPTSEQPPSNEAV